MPPDEIDLTTRRVDVDPRVDRATEPDEAAVLEGLYGPPDADGVFRGGGI